MVAQAQSTPGNGDQDARKSAGQGMPMAVRAAILGGVCGVLAGAVYLIAVRGEALLLDLAKLGQIFCL